MKVANKNTPTKDNLLEAAKELMLEKGYATTSLDEICEKAKVTKGSFFHYFESKEELAKELLKQFASANENLMREAMLQAGDDPLERVYALLDFAIGMSKNPEAKGCLVGIISQELSETHTKIRSICAESFERTANLIRKDLIAAKAQYAPKSSIDIKDLAEYFIALGQGSMILMKAKQDRSIMQKNIILFKKYLKSIFGR